MLQVAELFVKRSINLVLLCFNLNTKETNYANQLKRMIDELNQDRYESKIYVLHDPSPEYVEHFMSKRVASYAISCNNPLIIETFT